MNSSAFLVSRKAARVSTLLLFGELFLDDALGELDPSSVLGPLGLPYLSRLVEKIQVLSAIEPLLPFRPRPEQSEAPRVKSSLQIGHQLQRRRGQHAFLPCMWRRGDLSNRRAKGESSSFLASDQWLERRAGIRCLKIQSKICRPNLNSKPHLCRRRAVVCVRAGRFPSYYRSSAGSPSMRTSCAMLSPHDRKGP